jgi:hypothetical protein
MACQNVRLSVVISMNFCEVSSMITSRHYELLVHLILWFVCVFVFMSIRSHINRTPIDLAWRVESWPAKTFLCLVFYFSVVRRAVASLPSPPEVAFSPSSSSSRFSSTRTNLSVVPFRFPFLFLLSFFLFFCDPPPLLGASLREGPGPADVFPLLVKGWPDRSSTS